MNNSELVFVVPKTRLTAILHAVLGIGTNLTRTHDLGWQTPVDPIIPCGFIPAPKSKEHFEMIFKAIHDFGFFVPRHFAETEPNLQQIIPYTILTDPTETRKCVIEYTRGVNTTEKRLANRRSIGIGGHINPSKHTDTFNISSEINREIEEELIFDGDGSDIAITFAGFINDDSDAVGSVHFGILYIGEMIDVQYPLLPREEEITSVRMRFVDDIVVSTTYRKFESWSKICMTNIDEIFTACETTKAYKNSEATKHES